MEYEKIISSVNYNVLACTSGDITLTCFSQNSCYIYVLK